MKKALGLILFFILFGTLTAGCGKILEKMKEVSNSGSENAQFSSESGEVSITAPTSWADDLSLNASAILQISDPDEEKYVIVIDDSKDTFSEDIELNDYTDLVKSNMEISVTDAEISDPEDTIVIGNQARYFEISGEVSKIKVKYMIMCVETPGKFYQVIGWTLTNRFDENKDEIRSVMESLKVSEGIVGTDDASETTGEDSTEFLSDSKNISITASSSWKDDSSINSDSVIHISNMEDDDYAIVIEEAKETFSEDTQLSDYTDLVKANMESVVTNADTTDIEGQTMNGNPAEYFEMSGEVDMIKISYMVTCVETQNNFYQVIGWTSTAKFEANKDKLSEVINSFKVLE